VILYVQDWCGESSLVSMLIWWFCMCRSTLKGSRSLNWEARLMDLQLLLDCLTWWGRQWQQEQDLIELSQAPFLVWVHSIMALFMHYVNNMEKWGLISTSLFFMEMADHHNHRDILKSQPAKKNLNVRSQPADLHFSKAFRRTSLCSWYTDQSFRYWNSSLCSRYTKRSI